MKISLFIISCKLMKYLVSIRFDLLDEVIIFGYCVELVDRKFFLWYWFGLVNISFIY